MLGYEQKRRRDMCERMFQFYVSKITREKKQQPIAEGAPNQTRETQKGKKIDAKQKMYMGWQNLEF